MPVCMAGHAALVALIDTSGHPNDLNVALRVRMGYRINDHLLPHELPNSIPARPIRAELVDYITKGIR